MILYLAIFGYLIGWFLFAIAFVAREIRSGPFGKEDSMELAGWGLFFGAVWPLATVVLIVGIFGQWVSEVHLG